MLNKRFLLRVILLDYILILLFCTVVTQATGMLNEVYLEPEVRDEPTLSAATMNETAPPTITATRTATTTPTSTPAPTQTRTRKNTPTEEPTKAPYVFPKPIYTRERASSASTGAMPTRAK